VRTRQFILALAVLCVAACAPARKQKAPSTPPPAPPSLIEVGTITLVNASGRFVLIDHGILSAPPGGGVLKSFTNGVESAELIVTEVKRGSFTIADIRSGEPQKGDRVFFVPLALRKPASPEAPNRTPMALPGSTLAPSQLPAPALDQ
jgi:hypothetical protein